MAVSPRSQFENVPWSAPEGLVALIRALLADNRDLRRQLVALESVVNSIQR